MTKHNQFPLLLGSQEKYKKDKRDLWTMQRVMAKERMSRRNRRYEDSGNETGSSKSSRAYKMIEKIVSLKSLQGGKERKVKKRPRQPPPQRTKNPVDLGLSGNYKLFLGLIICKSWKFLRNLSKIHFVN